MAPDTRTSDDKPKLGSKKITAMIIDDTDLMRDIMKDILGQFDVKVVAEASEGRTGVELAVEHEPDLILLDILMPEMNGYLALQEIMGRLHDPFVVMMTSVEDEEVRKKALLEGAQDYIAKTLPTEEIRERLKKCVAHLRSP